MTFRNVGNYPHNNSDSHILRPESSIIFLSKVGFLKLVIEGKVEGRLEVSGGRGRRRKQLLDDLLRKR
jgi:hypothetical protein